MAFAQNNPLLGPPSPRLYVTSLSNEPVSVTVILPGMYIGLLWPASRGPPFYQNTYVIESIGQATRIDFPSDIQMSGTNIENKGLTRIISLNSPETETDITTKHKFKHETKAITKKSSYHDTSANKVKYYTL